MINVAIVGLGYIAKKAALGVKYSNSANLYMAVSRRKERTELFAKDLEINKTGTFEEMLNDPNVQLVYICTSDNVHRTKPPMAVVKTNPVQWRYRRCFYAIKLYHSITTG